MKCVILASGQGTRLLKKGDSKPLIPLIGIPLIERVILTAQRSGISDFFVVTGYNGEKVRDFLDELKQRKNISITHLINDEWEKENGISVLKAKPFMDEKFILLMCDHIFNESILITLQKEIITDDEVLLAVDVNTENNKFVDIEDVTRVRIEGNRIVDIGKNIDSYNAFDTGIFLCSPAIFTAIEKSTHAGDSSLSGGMRRLAERGKARRYAIRESYWIDVDDEKALKKAERLLYRNLSKRTDGIIARHINRKFSKFIFTPLFLKLFRGITPNQVSFLSFLVGLASSLLFFIGRPIAGALLIQAASILDGSDGEIARLKQMESPVGNFFDAVLDRYADGLILAGMFYYSLMMIGNSWVLGIFLTPFIISIAGGFAILGNTMVSYTSAKSVLNFGYRYAGRWIAAGRGRDIRLFILFIGGILSFLHPAFVFLALCVIAILSNTIVVWRTVLSLNYSKKEYIFRMVDNVRAIIFDFDGTLVDSMSFLTDLATRLMKDAFHITGDEAKRVYLETSGLDFASQMELLFPDHPAKERVIRSFEAEKVEQIFSKPLFNDALHSLKYFRSREIKTFIVSGTKEEILSEYCKLKGLEDRVDEYYGFRPGFTKREQHALILENLNFQPEELLFVGDSLKDYYFAKEKGMQFMGVSGTFQKRDFRNRGVPCIGCLAELVRVFEKAGRYHRRLAGTPQ